MLNCGKVIGQLSKISRHAHGNHLQGPLKYVGIISVDSSRHESTKGKKPYRFSGSTLKAEECVPSAQRPEEKKPPPTIASPSCELGPNPNCPPSCHDTCSAFNTPEGGGDQGNNPFKYWKEVLLALILTGVAIVTVSQLSPNKLESPKKVKKKDTKGEKKKRREVVKSPLDSSLIPSEVPYLLIGGGPASFSAFRSIKSRDPKAKVLIVTEEGYNPYMKPPLSKEVWYDKERKSSTQFSFRQWHGTPRSFFYEPPEFFTQVDKLNGLENGGVAVASGWKVNKIDVNKKIAYLEDGHEIKYNKCLLATGSTAKNLEVFESAENEVKRKVLPYRTLDDFLELEENVHNPNVRNIVIIGGGFLGSELACSLAQNLDREKKKVTQIFKEKFIMAQVLPEYLSEWTTNKATEVGVSCLGNTEVKDFEMKNGKLMLTLSGDEVMETDQVIVAVGAEANTDLAKVSELETHPKLGGYLVNSELESRSNLWVAGDAACFYDIKLGRRRVEHYDNAVISGRLAGENMTGAGKPYKHQSMFWSDLGLEVGYEAIGIIDSTLPTVGIFLKKGEKVKTCKEPQASQKQALQAENVSHESEESKTENSEESKTENSEKSKTENSKESKIENSGESKANKCENLDSCEGVDVESETVPIRKKFDFDKGVIFYLRDDIVVGIVLWNIFNRMSIARQVLARDTKYDELTEISKWFTIHED
ncbi:apoptosis-inducing factor 1, mitochondrial isoform X2 [Belonocnema kinseyi]|uniref:apoptosis-inducing factor 1, mitochondrial isoform X2 n=1 Tax=Belonocnema kinseyi TaxID=2817044 RepID=UPI00143DA2E7|nr:apoptosis-inducing factor 1, mitochondrial isoform X2 [Belonocnema kinseyi]